MSYKPQSSFSAGEYDPALRERTTLQKRDSGLSKLRGFFVGKTGRLISMPGTSYSAVRKNPGRCVTYYPEFTDYEVEFSVENILGIDTLVARITDLVAGTFIDTGAIHNFPDPFTEDELENLHFTSSGPFLFIFCKNRPAIRMVLGNLDPTKGWLTNRLTAVDDIINPYPIIGSIITAESSTGVASFDVEYAVTLVIEGEETLYEKIRYLNTGTLTKFQAIVAANQKSTIVVNFPGILSLQNIGIKTPVEMRVYRKPFDGGAYGYVGSATDPAPGLIPASDLKFKFIDYGQGADFTNLPPELQKDFENDMLPQGTLSPVVNPATGTIYQQRLILSGTNTLEATFASRPSRQHLGIDFGRDFPLSATSSLAFKPGTSDTARVLRYLDVGGLAAFTTRGIYVTPDGPIVPENTGMTRKGNWVIDETVEPMIVPGGFMFVEKSTGAIIQFSYSNELASFTGGEISIYSNHLFDGKRVKSWAYQSGLTPVIWVVMSDGTVNVLTYLPEQEMKAWSWVDTDGKYETVGVHRKLDGTNDVYFTVLRNGVRVREKLAERFNVDFKDYIGCHSAKVFKTQMTGTVDATQLVGATYALVGDPGTFANTAGNGAVGSQFRFFSKTGTPITFEVTAYVGTDEVTVLSIDDREIPADELNDLVIYKVFTTVTGLAHLEGKQVYVKNDGFIESNPLAKNFEGQDLYGTKTVVGGQITLDNPGAIIIVGLPMVNDARLLEVDTVEQQPALLASVTLNKVELAYYRSRGVHTSYDFPDDDTTKGMTDSESYIADDMTIQAAEVPLLPYTKRVEIIDVGSWDSHGQFAMRHVDGHPIEILSVISDLDVLRKRGN